MKFYTRLYERGFEKHYLKKFFNIKSLPNRSELLTKILIKSNNNIKMCINNNNKNDSSNNNNINKNNNNNNIDSNVNNKCIDIDDNEEKKNDDKESSNKININNYDKDNNNNISNVLIPTIITHIPKIVSTPRLNEILQFPNFITNTEEFQKTYKQSQIRIINSNNHNSINMTLNHKKDKCMRSKQ